MADPILFLNAALQAAYDHFELGADPVTRPSDRADYQSNGILPLAKRLGRNPREVATELMSHLDLANVAEVEVAGPGFLNITLADPLMHGSVCAPRQSQKPRSSITRRPTLPKKCTWVTCARPSSAMP
jgi:arginyl-tRNA synthetase